MYCHLNIIIDESIGDSPGQNWHFGGRNNLDS